MIYYYYFNVYQAYGDKQEICSVSMQSIKSTINFLLIFCNSVCFLLMYRKLFDKQYNNISERTTALMLMSDGQIKLDSDQYFLCK